MRLVGHHQRVVWYATITRSWGWVRWPVPEDSVHDLLQCIECLLDGVVPVPLHGGLIVRIVPGTLNCSAARFQNVYVDEVLRHTLFINALRRTTVDDGSQKMTSNNDIRDLYNLSQEQQGLAVTSQLLDDRFEMQCLAVVGQS